VLDSCKFGGHWFLGASFSFGFRKNSLRGADLRRRWSRKNLPRRQTLLDPGLVVRTFLDAFGLWAWTLGFAVKRPLGNRNGTCCVIAAYHFLPVLGRPFDGCSFTFRFHFRHRLECASEFRLSRKKRAPCTICFRFSGSTFIPPSFGHNLTARQTLHWVYVFTGLQRETLRLIEFARNGPKRTSMPQRVKTSPLTGTIPIESQTST
jgi:hypothetical protein